jgi:hypothetical protein
MHSGTNTDPQVEVWVGLLHGNGIGSVNAPDSPIAGDVAVSLVLRTDAAAQTLTGSIAFGDANSAPTLNALPLGVMPNRYYLSFWYSARFFVVTGFEYRVIALYQTGAQLRFSLSSAQLWRSWCCQDDGSYNCPDPVPSEDTQIDPLGPITCTQLPITLTFELRIDGDRMEGTWFPSSYPPPAMVKLRRRH